MINKLSLGLALSLAICYGAILQVASLPVFEEDKLPAIDLRKTGCLMPIEDEGVCGASYAYVTVALGAYYECQSKKSSSPVHYNARFITDCGKSFSENIGGCRGGFVSKALDFVRENGLPLFQDYQSAKSKTGASQESDQCPVAATGKVSSGQPNWQINLQQLHSLKGTKLIKLKFEQIYDHLSKHGPVVANLELWPGYESYSGEVFESWRDNGNFEFRSALIVGFDYNEDSRAYYTLWNSLGSNWGDKGYLKILEFSLWMHHVNFYGLVSGDAE